MLHCHLKYILEEKMAYSTLKNFIFRTLEEFIFCSFIIGLQAWKVLSILYLTKLLVVIEHDIIYKNLCPQCILKIRPFSHKIVSSEISSYTEVLNITITTHSILMILLNSIIIEPVIAPSSSLIDFYLICNKDIILSHTSDHACHNNESILL